MGEGKRDGGVGGTGEQQGVRRGERHKKKWFKNYPEGNNQPRGA